MTFYFVVKVACAKHKLTVLDLKIKIKLCFFKKSFDTFFFYLIETQTKHVQKRMKKKTTIDVNKM
jgi:hypothetical protein